jgi:nucleotide-binding universal stress UspA family protein
MIMPHSETGLPPPDTCPAVPRPADRDLVWRERVRASPTGPLLIAAEEGGRPDGPVRLAELLARRHRLNAHVLAVVPPLASSVSSAVSSVAGMEGTELDECRRQAARARLRARVGELVGLSSFFSTSAKLGELVSTVDEAARRRRVEYVLTDIAPAGDPLRGSTTATALRLARASVAPVLAVPPTTDDLPRSALVCTDFTEASARAALAVVPLLAHRGELTLAHIAPPLTGTVDEDWVASWNLWATTELRALADRLRAPNHLRVYLLLLRGNAESVVARSAGNFDLVAIGAPAADRRLLGTGGGVAAAVLRHAPGTVLLAPDPARNLQSEPACLGSPATAAGSSTH